VKVHHLEAGPFEKMHKEDLPGQLCAVTAGLMRAEAAKPAGWYDLVHSHYWMSGHVGWVIAERWGVPLVHTMHTMAAVKNASLAHGDSPETNLRLFGEEQIAKAATRLIANTNEEAASLIDYYGANAKQIDVVHPGVDLDVFSPGNKEVARARTGLASDALIVGFVGRLQKLKSPATTLRACRDLLIAEPQWRDRLRVVVCGAESGTSGITKADLEHLARELGIIENFVYVPPTSRQQLANLYRSCDVITVPSYSESFGLVALEAQACGTPVIATNVGGLTTAVTNEVTGLLLYSHSPTVWAEAMRRLLSDPQERDEMAKKGRRHAEGFSWGSTVDGLIDSYEKALHSKL
jgi:D-inositol-3-phosphate glycosyltransferase